MYVPGVQSAMYVPDVQSAMYVPDVQSAMYVPGVQCAMYVLLGGEVIQSTVTALTEAAETLLSYTRRHQTRQYSSQW